VSALYEQQEAQNGRQPISGSPISDEWVVARYPTQLASACLVGVKVVSLLMRRPDVIDQLFGVFKSLR